ncbi:PREDICTED: uncharacterized protein LOC106810531 isoform X2 [Priapulus caudatus]|uniref:Uncharacterized protein LOC106810531 isoform X2 n=1 Tax=Priapulus caudatus TaxID=37621 RepID=A0ABM1EB26_PRICU|nr:PREDICTED: uncharacterized protein LOC106810531 isoform X2 [Priapulus caudatus]
MTAVSDADVSYDLGAELRVTCTVTKSEFRLRIHDGGGSRVTRASVRYAAGYDDEGDDPPAPALALLTDKMCGPLYNELCGRDGNLLGERVILVGCPDGVVHGVRARTGDARVVCDLGEAVVHISAVSVSGAPEHDVVVAIGKRGKMAAFAWRASRVVYEEMLVAAPVLAACVRMCKVVVSTGDDLFCYELSFSHEDALKVAEHDLKIYGVQDVTWVSDDLLRVRKLNGRVFTCDVGDRLRSVATETSSIPCLRIQQLLTEISVCSQQLAVVSDALAGQSELLHDLRHVSDILSPGGDPSTLSCDVRVSATGTWPSVVRHTVVKLTNRTDRRLSRRWTVFVAVETPGGHTLSRCCALLPLASGSSQEVAVEMSEECVGAALRCGVAYAPPGDAVAPGTAAPPGVARVLCKTRLTSLDVLLPDPRDATARGDRPAVERTFSLLASTHRGRLESSATSEKRQAADAVSCTIAVDRSGLRDAPKVASDVWLLERLLERSCVSPGNSNNVHAFLPSRGCVAITVTSLAEDCRVAVSAPDQPTLSRLCSDISHVVSHLREQTAMLVE